MEPLIKWPGGKGGEFAQIAPFFPRDYDRYIEPFFGGGAVFFRLEPARAVINDTCAELMNVYRLLAGTPAERKPFLAELLRYVEAWEKIPRLLDLLSTSRDAFHAPAVGTRFTRPLFSTLFDSDFLVDSAAFDEQLLRSLRDKHRRVRKLEETQGVLSAADQTRNFETALRSGFYLHFRALMNAHPSVFSPARAAANFYFVREFCYGSMFRYNASGEFNIPYGGMAYNRKDFRGKVARLGSRQLHALLAGAHISCSDFEQCLQSLKPGLTDRDFLFCDPPYDSDFSRYNNQEFGSADQRRLADFLLATPARFVLVIKDTDLIRGLYAGHAHIRIDSFAKSYRYNVKGRNERQAQHLVIRNF